MILLAMVAAIASSPSETWSCFFRSGDDGDGYRSTFVIADGRVIETGLLGGYVTYAYQPLEDNEEHFTFARSQYNAMLNAGIRLDQVAVVVTIDRQTNGAKKIFLRDHGESVGVQHGECVRQVV